MGKGGAEIEGDVRCGCVIKILSRFYSFALLHYACCLSRFSLSIKQSPLETPYFYRTVI